MLTKLRLSCGLDSLILISRLILSSHINFFCILRIVTADLISFKYLVFPILSTYTFVFDWYFYFASVKVNLYNL